MKTSFHCGVSMSEGLTSYVNTKNQALSQKLKSGSPKRIDFFPASKVGHPDSFLISQIISSHKMLFAKTKANTSSKMSSLLH